MAKLVQETIPFKDAMNNIALLSTLDMNALPAIGIVNKHKIVTDDKEFPETEVLWLSAEGSDPLLDVLDLTFHSIHEHLLHSLKEIDWEDEKSRRALESMMALCGESAQRLEKYLDIRLGKKVSLAKRLSLVTLQEDYAKFSSRVDQDAPRQASDQLQNVDLIRRDKDYELFYIRKEDGSPYFTTEILRHMRLISDFESEGESFEEDPLLQVRSMMDRDLQASAKQILKECHPLIVDFYKMYKRLSSNDLAIHLSESVMALLLAGNPRNLLQNTTSKSSQQYFEDFILFLRAVFRSDEYQKFVAYPPEKSDKVAHLLLNLAHLLAGCLYTHTGGVKQEAVGLIHRTTRKGSEPSALKLKKGETLWSQLSVDDENYRSRLAKFPSGPLFKTLDLVRQEEGEPVPFDPMTQGNIPMQLFEMEGKNHPIQFLRMASPTRQGVINKAEILDEVRGLLRLYASMNPKRKHLLINLQDRTSWKEFMRCKALEEMQKNAEFSPTLAVVTLAKDTDFYSQAKEYAESEKTADFLTLLTEQFASTEGHGFYFPAPFRTGELSKFIQDILPFIHTHFFGKQKALNRREREDFIEILYQFLTLKLIDYYAPSSVSFTCKDGIDTGAAASAIFYAFLHLLKGDFEDRTKIDYFRWLLYAPSLFVRERALDPERFNRALTALERIDGGLKENGKAIQKGMGDFFSLIL